MSRVRDFHLRFGEPAPEVPPLLPDPDAVRRRGRLLRAAYESLGARLSALPYAKDPQKVPELLRSVLHDAAQLCYVAEGTAISLGLPFDEAFEEVHQAHMAQADPDLTRLVPDHINYEEVAESNAPAPD